MLGLSGVVTVPGDGLGGAFGAVEVEETARGGGGSGCGGKAVETTGSEQRTREHGVDNSNASLCELFVSQD